MAKKLQELTIHRMSRLGADDYDGMATYSFRPDQAEYDGMSSPWGGTINFKTDGIVITDTTTIKQLFIALRNKAKADQTLI